MIVAVAALAAGCAPTAPPSDVAAPRPAPPIVHDGSTTAASDKPAAEISIGRPSRVSAGHVLLAQIAARTGAATTVAPTVAPPDGWTQVGMTRSARQLTSWVFLRVAGDSEPDSYDFTAGSPSTLVASINGFGGVDPVEPLDTFAGSAGADPVALAGPAVRTRSGNTVAVWLGTQLSATNGCPRPRIAPPADFRRVGDVCNPRGPGLALGVAIRQLGAAADQPRWSGRSSSPGPAVVQVVTLRPVGAARPGQTPRAQVADRYAVQPALSPGGPGRYGNLLWDGLGPAKQKFVMIGPDVLYQPSGLAASRTDTGVLFVHSEKDRGTMIAISSRNAEVLGRYRVQIPDLFDWEDIAAGPCPVGSCLYAADTGRDRDVAKPGTVFSVTRFAQPDVSGGQKSGTLTGDTFPFRYPGGAVADAEALLVHPWTGDIYVITKTAKGISDVYQFPNPLPQPGVVSELSKVATLTLPTDPRDPQAAKVTSAAMHPVANRFLIRTYRHVYEYRGPEGGSLAQAFAGDRVELTDPGEGQGEAITYAIDGSAYYTIGEAEKPPYRLNRVDRS